MGVAERILLVISAVDKLLQTTTPKKVNLWSEDSVDKSQKVQVQTDKLQIQGHDRQEK